MLNPPRGIGPPLNRRARFHTFLQSFGESRGGNAGRDQDDSVSTEI
jgi:hypothetical protein